MMKMETAIKILKDRAKWYGLSNSAKDFDKYIQLVTNCGGTKREEEALERFNVELWR